MNDWEGQAKTWTRLFFLYFILKKNKADLIEFFGKEIVSYLSICYALLLCTRLNKNIQ